jgi:lycopene beta-cyclase
VITDDGQFIADYIFDSITPLSLDKPQRHNMLQHFKGWEITTPQPVFDLSAPTMMDYRVEQQGVGVRFGYVLPINQNRALVEYTVFSDKLLNQEEYDKELHTYIRDFLKIRDFTIEDEEFGVIPMTDERPKVSKRNHIIKIGTSGGYVKASTGYAFKRTQRFTQELVSQLLTTGKPQPRKKTFRQWFKNLLDSTLLNVFLENRYSGKAVFTRLYKNNPTPRLFAFLDEDTSLWEDLQVMSTVPLGAFARGLVGSLFRRF